MPGDDAIEFWRLHVGPGRAWVIFEHGTCVVLTDPTDDLAGQARALLAKHGPVHVATPAADFTVHRLTDSSDLLVTYDHPDIANFVASGEVGAGAPTHIAGLIARAKRARDAIELKAIHVEPIGP